MSNNVNDYLTRNGTRFGEDINQKMKARPAPFISLVKRERWKEQESAVQKTFVWERANTATAIANEAPVGFKNMGKEPDEGTLDASTYCIPPSDSITFKQSGRQYRLQHKAFWGPTMCTNELRDVHVREKQMGAAAKTMADEIRETWIDRNRGEYVRLSMRKVTLDENWENGLIAEAVGTTFAPVAGTGRRLTSGFLDYFYEYECQHGGHDGAFGTADGRPVFGLITSGRTSRGMITIDDQKREDFRYANRSAEILKALGVKLQLNGWSHIIDDTIPRWDKFTKIVGTSAALISGVTNLTLWGNTNQHALKVDIPTSTALDITPGSQLVISKTGQTTRKLVVVKVTNYTSIAHTVYCLPEDEFGVLTYDNSDASDYAIANGTNWNVEGWVNRARYVYDSGTGIMVPNPKWLGAGWEDTIVFHDRVMTSMIPVPITQSGKASFELQNYVGDVRWTNYPDKDNNPDGTLGQFRSVVASGARPDNPEFGILIRHLAAPKAFEQWGDTSLEPLT